MIKLVLFDLDGVLIDAKKIHYDALNEALGEQYAISEKEHTNLYDGRKTFEKLNLLTEQKGLPTTLHKEIYVKKQSITMEKISALEPIKEIIKLFQNPKLENKRFLQPISSFLCCLFAKP